ncbi:hypothetical protein D3C84_593850 [compost metagenome]
MLNTVSLLSPAPAGGLQVPEAISTPALNTAQVMMSLVLSLFRVKPTLEIGALKAIFITSPSLIRLLSTPMPWPEELMPPSLGVGASSVKVALMPLIGSTRTDTGPPAVRPIREVVTSTVGLGLTNSKS